MKVRPVGDRVLVELDSLERVSKGGIVIPECANTQAKIKGTVSAVGKGRILNNGKIVEPQVKVGDRVYFGEYSGDDIVIDDVQHKILKEKEILCVQD